MADADAPDRSLGSRDDVLLERLLDELRAATVSLAISLKGCKRSTDNLVLRMSAEQQFESGIQHVGELLALPSVVHGEDAARRTTEAIAPFVLLVPQLHWTSATSRVTTVFQDAAGIAFAPEKVKVEGRPCAAFASLLGQRATIPAVAVEPPDAEPSAPSPPEEPVVLFEAIFTHGGSSASHDAQIGGMYLAFLVHVRGLSEDEARRNVSPAALLGFAQSLDKALAGYEGVVAFLVVRKDGRDGKEGKGEAQLRRLAARPPERRKESM